MPQPSKSRHTTTNEGMEWGFTTTEPKGHCTHKGRWTKKKTMPAVVHSHSSTPRSYVVETAQGEQYRRNLHHLLVTLKTPSSISKGLDLSLHAEHKNTEVIQATETPVSLSQGTVTRSRRVCQLVERLNLWCLWIVRDFIQGEDGGTVK